MIQQSLLTELKTRHLVADGGMGTALRELPGQDADDTILELLNLDAPELVRGVHESFVAAGADVLLTNTYGASALRLDGLDSPSLLEQVNVAAVRIAREAARGAERPIWIVGSVGPLGALRYDRDVMRVDQIAATYARQMAVLANAGVDLIILETMDDYREIVGALRAAKKLGVPVALQVATPDAQTVGGKIDLATVVSQAEELGAAMIGANCRLDPATMAGVARHLVALTDLPISIQPNAGSYGVDPYGRLKVVGTVGQYRRMVEDCLRYDVRLIGGCCYTTPEHIRVARETVDRWCAATRTASIAVAGGAPTPVADAAPATTPSAPAVIHPGQAPRRVPSRLETALAEHRFITCVEVDPPTDEECRNDPGILDQKIDGTRYLEHRCGVDLITIADHTMGQPWLDAFPFAEVLRPHLRNADLLLHYSCRNKAETDITGNFASYRIYGYKNILVITGDRPPEADGKSFFVYSSSTLLQRIQRDHGDYFFLAASFDHTRGIERGGTLGLEGEVKRLQRKMAAGARLALTQPIFLDRLELLREKTKDLDIPIFPGVMPIMSANHARNMNANFPGMRIPDSVIQRHEEVGDDRRRRAQIAIDYAAETARAVKAMGFPGVYLIMSLNRFDVIKEVITRMRD
jgi:homocysteine S-methyltransferase